MMNNPEWFYFWAFYVAVTGLCIGSFLNVVALRALWGESIVFPPSKCHSCGKKLLWYHNIPVLSWVFLRGRCGFCKEKISAQYPIVELLNGVLYLAIYLTFGLSFKSLFLCILASLLIVLSITDFKERVVCEFHVYPIIALGLLYSALHLGSVDILESFFGVGAAFLFFEISSRFIKSIVKERLFGEGDTLIAMGIGAYFGWKTMFAIVFCSIIIQVLACFFPLLIQMFKNKKYLKGACGVFTILTIAALILSVYTKGTVDIALFLICIIPMVLFIFLLMKDLRNQKVEEFYTPPFGPALALSTLIFIFFEPNIMSFLKSVINNYLIIV